MTAKGAPASVAHRPVGLASAAGAVLLLSGFAASSSAQVAARAAPAASLAAHAASGGYLSADEIRTLAQAVPELSADGSEAQAADRALSERYRGYEHGDRWLLATAHSELSPRLAAQHFDCALGVRFASAPTPRLTAMFDKLLKDANEAAETAKARAFRPRPVGVNPDRPSCQTVSEAGRKSASYPSGSASVGAAYGEAVAALDPAHAEAARAIGHQIALSRAVCGMHYPADVAAGETLGKAVFGQVAADPALAADLEAALSLIHI